MKLKSFLTILLAVSTATHSLAARNHDKVAALENPVPVSLVKNVTGFYGERMKLNRDVYLKNFPIDKYVDFIVERQHTTWDWTKAEQHGKWLESAYLSAIQSGDSELMSKARTVLKRIVESQEENGYLGATARSYRSDKRPVRGMDAYELYFVFHAFITVYEQTGDKDALAAVEKLAATEEKEGFDKGDIKTNAVRNFKTVPFNQRCRILGPARTTPIEAPVKTRAG